MSTKKLRCGISVKELNKLIAELDVEINRLAKVETDIVTRLTLMGKLLVMQNIMKYQVIDEGMLLDSVMTSFGLGEGRVWVSAPHASFVEYGTGVVGQQSTLHPNLPMTWKHDSNEHGESGWVYYDERYGYIRTRGQPAKPFFFDSYMQLKNRAKLIAREELKK